MRRAWMIGGAILAAAALSAVLFATAAGKKPPEPPGRPDGVPASIQLTPDPIAIQCDGADASTVTVRVTDARGRPVPDGTEVFFDAVYGFVDPVVAETNRGEASTQARFYEYAAHFPGLTNVDVTVGPLRASVGIDCLPPAPPCGPDASPPCPTPVPCNAPFSPPMPFSPPCETPPCSDTNSPPIGPDPPCPTPTPDPACWPQSPPCSLTQLPTSTPSNTVEPTATHTPVGSGTIRFQSYAPLTAAVGQRLTISIEAVDVSIPYSGYQWLFSSPDFVGSFGETIEPAHPFTLCALPGGVAPGQFYGGCLLPNSGTVDYAGRLTTFSFVCLVPGDDELRLTSPDPNQTAFATSLLWRGGIVFGGPDLRTVPIECTSDG